MSCYFGSYKDFGISECCLGNFWVYDFGGVLNLKELWFGVLLGFKLVLLGVSVVNFVNCEL